MHLFLVLSLFLAEPTRELQIFVDQDNKKEMLLKRAFLEEDFKNLINPIVLNSENEEKIDAFCDSIADRIDFIKKRTKITFNDRYFEKVDFSVKIGYDSPKKIPDNLHLVTEIQLIEFWVDEIFFAQDHLNWKIATEEAADEWIYDDYVNRHKFVKDLMNNHSNWKFEGYNPIVEENEDSTPSLPSVIIDETGVIRKIEDFGFKPKPKLKLLEPKKKICPIKTN